MYNEKSKKLIRSGVLTAYSRCFTDIQNSQKIFFKSLKHMLNMGICFNPNLFNTEISVELEARYKSIDHILFGKVKEHKGQCIVVEIGSGLSTRKINFFSEVISYVEVDFPALVEEKEKVYGELGFHIKKESIGIDLEDSYNFEYLKKLQKDYNVPVIVISEGLFWYLRIDSLKILVQNVCDLLNLYGGCWIIGDCPVKTDFSNLPEYRTIISESTGKQMNQPFETFFEFEALFKSYGFNIHRFGMDKLIPIENNFSAQLFGIKKHDYLNRLSSYCDIALLELNPHNTVIEL